MVERVSTPQLTLAQRVQTAARQQRCRDRKKARPRQLLGQVTQDDLFRQLLDLITAECRRAGMLP